MKRLYFVFLASILFIFAQTMPLYAQGASIPDVLNTQNHIVYGFDREFPPFSYEPAGNPGGFDVDLITAIFKDSNFKLTMRPMQWDQILRELAAGGIQITTGMMKTDQRALLYSFSDQPIFPVNIKLFVKPSNRTGNIRMLKGKTVSVQKESFYQRVLEEFGGMNVKLYNTELEALKALINDQVEVFCGRDKTTYYYLDKLNIANISAVGTPLYVSNVYMAANKERPDLLKLINEKMRLLQASGEYGRLFQKWFVKDLSQEERDNLIKAASQATMNAYAPYSKRPMGAALLTQSGKTYVGSNIENSVMSVGVSALQVAVFKAVSDGETEIRAVVTVGLDGVSRPPTAEDRQILSEFGLGILAIIEPSKGNYITPMISELLPFDQRSGN